MKQYVDANVAILGQRVNGANLAIITANTAMKQYVDANVAILGQRVNGANLAIITANTAMKQYVDGTFFPRTGGTITGNAIITGNLTVSGSTTFINTQELQIGDNIITLNADLPSSQTPSENSGIEVNRGSTANVALIWNETSKRWTFTNNGTNYFNIPISSEYSLYTATNGISLSGTVFGLTGQSLALHNLATNGIISRTGTGTVAARTIAASTGISVTNGNGVSGNPTITNTAPHIGTNLGVTAGTTAGPTVTSSTGTNATLPTASGTASGVVTTGNQTWAGTKTFSAAVVLSTAGTATTHAVRADRSLTAGDGLSGGGNLTADRSFAVDSTVVRTFGDQTISGIKTFSGSLRSTRVFSDGGVNRTGTSIWEGPASTGANRIAIFRIDPLSADRTYTFPNVSGNVALTSSSITGNAATATKLQNARTIGGISFDGSANINLPGVNTAGNQNTTGNAATATKLQTARTIGGISFDGSANINLPGVNTVGNQNTTGSAASLTTARAINGTNFNGSAAITTTNWGTARTVTIGSTGKSVNGSADVSWSITEILPTTANLRINSLGIGTDASGINGQIRAAGDITAFFSDIRLKENITEIEDAVEKVMSLRGVHYTPNDIATSYGFKNESTVGVIAQEVEKVLPEVIKPAPFDTGVDGISLSGENYKTVQYEKLVPLLIEAIKELKREIDELKK
jgi:hypothetical protein